MISAPRGAGSVEAVGLLAGGNIGGNVRGNGVVATGCWENGCNVCWNAEPFGLE